MSKDLEQQFRQLFESDYPGIETLRSKLIEPLWNDIGHPDKSDIDISEADKKKINKITIFANQGSEINFVDVELTDSVVLKNNRVTINKYIATHIVDIYQSALIFFHYKDNQNEWRISYVYKGENNKDTTNAKRYTYICGKNYKCRTAAERFSKLENANGYPDNDKLVEAFNVEALTKEFFGQLFSWYEWACKLCKFPGKNCIAAKAELTDENNQLNLIRLITRIMFVWFIKQKDLVPEWVFDKSELKNILSDPDFSSSKKSNYYNGILQNLFFGALNKKIDERSFAAKSEDGVPNEQYGIKTYYRDDNKQSFFKISHDKIIERFIGVPFLNGGLFECLDKVLPGEKFKVQYIDGFSRNENRRAFVPNILFWNESSNEKETGLINILSRYNFTVEESTPSDIQVALDPELLGKIFENLLGVYNPETSESARKESGSFYTPREIVAYMVNRSIMSYLQEKVPEVSEENLEKLTNDDKSDDDGIKLTEEQIFALRKALFEIKVIDPACGSGAFPMGILNKLVEIHTLLNKLSAKIQSDHNLYIKKGQFVNYTPNDDLKINAEYLGDQKFNLSVNGIEEKKIYNSQELTLHVKEIINQYNKKLNKNTIANLFSQGRIDDGISFNAIKTKQDIRQIVDADSKDIVWQYKSYNVENKFRQYRNEEENLISLDENEDGLLNYDSLYNLKTQIIQNSIFGVDIQPIAVQICKLRFFISLICEQPKTGSKENNYGYNPLPNLETKFVAANTLIGLNSDEKGFMDYSDEKIKKLKADLIEVRKNHFSSKTSAEKKANRELDEKIRQEIISYLQQNSVDIDKAKIEDYENQIKKLEEDKMNLPEDLVSIDNSQPDLFGNITDSTLTYDRNSDKRTAIDEEIKRLKKNCDQEKNKNEKLETLESLEELVKWNPYDQSAEASSYFDADWMFGIENGFDICIGNPPYVRRTKIDESDKSKYESIYYSANGQYDLYLLFIEFGIKIIRTKGVLCYINPIRFFNSDYGTNCRKFITKNTNILEILDVSQLKVFESAMTYPCILLFRKDSENKQNKIKYRKLQNLGQVYSALTIKPQILSQNKILQDSECRFLVYKYDTLNSVIKKIDCNKTLVSTNYSIARGLANNKVNFNSHKRKALKSKMIKKYELKGDPLLVDTEYYATFKDEMLLLPRTVAYLQATLKNKDDIVLDRIYYLTNLNSLNNKFVLGCLNSKITNEWFEYYYSTTKVTGNYFDLNGNQIGSIPIPLATDKDIKCIEALVDKILLYKRENKSTALEEHQIDQLVYKLYNLTDEEIALIEGNM